MDLSVITVTWNNEENIEEQIKSVFSGYKNITCEEIISDNGSQDNTVEVVRKKFIDVKIIENKENLGFGSANNKGLELAQGEFILFLNPI